MWSILVTLPCAFNKNAHSAAVGYSVLYMFVRSSLFIYYSSPQLGKNTKVIKKSKTDQLDLEFSLCKYEFVFFGDEMGILCPSCYSIKKDSSAQ